MERLGTHERPLRVAVVGAGPAGFYAADFLLKEPLAVRVDVFERLPTPFGLARAGVAPDHPVTRRVTRAFDRTAGLDGFEFWGNVTVGRDVSVAELRNHYDAVVIATGMEHGAALGIPGEDLPGSHPASALLFWTNGHPDYAGLPFDFSTETAIVVGNGNVALEAARLLARTPDELRHTDIADYALDALAESRVREIHVIGRRGPVQARFHQQGLDEMAQLAGCRTVADPAALALDPLSQAELERPDNYNAQRNLPVLQRLADAPGPPRRRQCRFEFLKGPVAIRGADRVESMVLGRNELAGEPGRLKARGTGETEELPCGLVLRAVGHHGRPIDGVPFDAAERLMPNEGGRVLEDGRPVPGLYTTGWIKRGPTGLIGENKADSIETVDHLVADLSDLEPCRERDSRALAGMLAARGVRVVSYGDWRAIDEAEAARGQAAGRPRMPFSTREAMLAVLER